MGMHTDNNMPGFTKQVIGIFGNFDGGQLTVEEPDGRTTLLGKGVHVFDAAKQHCVSEVTSGYRYSVIAYAKKCDNVLAWVALGYCGSDDDFLWI